MILNAAYIPEIWRVSMCGTVSSCPEGETHQSDIRVNTESGALESRLRYGSDKDIHRELQMPTHSSTYAHMFSAIFKVTLQTKEVPQSSDYDVASTIIHTRTDVLALA